jgi:restriction endonuclease S subunit
MGLQQIASTEWIVFSHEEVLPEYLRSIVVSDYFHRYFMQTITGVGGSLSRANIAAVGEIRVPLPPLDIQHAIAAEIESYQKVIDGARAVVENYKPRIDVKPEWDCEPISNIFDTKSGTTPRRNCPEYYKNGTIPWVKTLDLNDGVIVKTDELITSRALKETHLSILPVGTVLVAMYGGFKQIGRTGVLAIEATHNQAMTALLPSPRVLPEYLNTILVSVKDYWKTVANSTRKDPNITKADVLRLIIPIPPLTVQQAIVDDIRVEQELVNANKELIERMENKIEGVLKKVWGEE